MISGLKNSALGLEKLVINLSLFKLRACQRSTGFKSYFIKLFKQ